MNIAKSLYNRMSAKFKDSLRKIYSVEEFRAAIKRERFRSDRNKHLFSLIVFDIGTHEKSKNLARHLLNILTSRVRISDEVGWYDSQRVGVLLPNTTSKGAWRLVNMIFKEMSTISTIPGCTVNTYPSTTGVSWNSTIETSQFTEDMYVKRAVEHKIPLWKRALDILITSIGLLILSPLFVCVAIMIKIVSPGPVFFKQVRVGRSGKIFTLLKFRTMRVNNDVSVHRDYLKELINGDSNGDKPMTKLDDDSRTIPVGKILRKTCIDELPQMINVLRGEMSLIGPRPCIPYEAEEYLRWHARRFDITPGITGLWQVSGKNRLTFKEMIRLDIKYSLEQSFWLDMKILFKTPLIVLTQFWESSVKRKEVGEPAQNEIEVKTAEVVF